MGVRTLEPTCFETLCLGLTGFFYRDDFLGVEAADQVLAEANSIVAQGHMRPAGTGRDAKVSRANRSDDFCWIEPGQVGPGIEALMARFEAIRLVLNREAYLGLVRYEMQLACYALGSPGYSRHFDAFKGGDSNRRLTAIYYLNPQWKYDDGGRLGLYLPGGQLDVDPLHDRLLIFMADEVEHAVLPVHAHRMALTAWFYSS